MNTTPIEKQSRPSRRVARTVAIAGTLLVWRIAGALDYAPADILANAHLSDVRRLSSNAYVHYANVTILLDTGGLCIPVSDLELPIAGTTFRIERIYLSRSAAKGMLGQRWLMDLETALQVEKDSLVLINPDGSRVPFKLVAPGQYASQGRSRQSILAGTDGTFSLRDEAQTRVFDAAGKLIRIEQDATIVALAYVNGRLESASVLGQPVLRFAYNPAGLLESMTDRAGRVATFAYTDAGDLSDEVNFQGVSTKYQYDPTRRLSAIEYANGATIHINVDEKGRVASLAGPVQRMTHCAYSISDVGPRTVVMDELGRSTSYQFVDRGRYVEMTDALLNVTRKRFDPQGRLVEYTDPAGRATTFVWDELGRLTRKTSYAAAETYAYDQASSRLLSIADANDKIEVTYNPAGLMTSFKDPAGRVTRYTFDQRQNLSSIIMPDGRRLSFEYDVLGHLQRAAFPDGTTETYEFDALGHIRTITGGQGQACLYTYDPRGRLVKQTDPVGNSIELRYNAAGALAERRHSSGVIETYAYNAAGQLISLKRSPDGVETTWKYDLRGRVEEITRPGNRKYRYAYDAADRLVAVVDPIGRNLVASVDMAGRISELKTGATVSSYAYDARGRLERENLGKSLARGYEFDDRSRVTGVTLPGGDRKYEYDGRNRLVRITSSGNDPTISYSYDENDRVIEEVDSARGATRFQYDDLGRLKSLNSDAGHQEEYAYNARGLIGLIRIVGGETIKYEYDAAGRVARAESDATGSIAYAYDPAGRLVRIEGGADAVRQFSFDPAGNITCCAEPDGAHVYRYDPAGNLLTIKSATGRETRFEHDAAGRLLRTTHADGQKREYAYDADDHLVSVAREDGTRETFEYDPAGLLARWSVAGKPLYEVAYNPARQPTTRQVAGRSFTYDHNPKGQLVAKTDTAAKLTLAYQYHPAGNIASVQLPDGQAINYKYTPAGQLARIAGPANTEIVIANDAFGRRESVTLGQTAIIRYGYNPNGSVKFIRATKPDNVPIYVVAYEYDASGRLARADYNGSAYAYSYDGYSRLRQVILPGGARQTLVYDPDGNIVALDDAKLAYNLRNQLTQFGPTQFKYDPVGSLVERNASGAMTTFTYGPDRKLARIVLPDKVPVDYAYDDDGNLLIRSTPDQSTYFLRDRGDIIAEIAGGKTMAVYLLASPDQRIARITDGKKAFYVTDVNNSVLAILDEQGQIQNSYAYAPFGIMSPIKEALDNNYYYHGRFLDKKTGLYDFRARWYDPASLRFVQPDGGAVSLFKPESLNPYVFARNDPVNFGDPLGLEPKITWVSPTQAARPGLTRTLNRFQAGKIPAANYGSIPEGFRCGGVIDRGGWLYDVWIKRTGDRVKDALVIVRDLNQKAEGGYGGANITGQGLNEPLPGNGGPPASIEPPAPGAPAAEPLPASEWTPVAEGLQKWGGRALIVYGVYHSYNNISQAQDKFTQANIEAGGWLGGFLLGMKGGAIGGAYFGPWGAAIGGLGGGIVGAWAGGRLGDPNTYKGFFGTGEPESAYIAVQKEMSDWYCTNRPEIRILANLPDIISGKEYDSPNLDKLRDMADQLKQYWANQGVDTANFDVLFQQSLRRIWAANEPAQLPEYLNRAGSDPANQLPANPTEQDISRWRDRQVHRAYGWYLLQMLRKDVPARMESMPAPQRPAFPSG